MFKRIITKLYSSLKPGNRLPGKDHQHVLYFTALFPELKQGVRLIRGTRAATTTLKKEIQRHHNAT